MMHFRDKEQVVRKIDEILNTGGIFCLSIDKNQSQYINTGTRRVQIYPDTLDSITSLIEKTMMSVSKVVETEKAYIIVSKK